MCVVCAIQCGVLLDCNMSMLYGAQNAHTRVFDEQYINGNVLCSMKCFFIELIYNKCDVVVEFCCRVLLGWVCNSVRYALRALRQSTTT